MRDLVKKILEAETEARKAAQDLEAQGEELLKEALAHCRQVEAQSQSETKRKIEDLTREAETAIQQQREAVERDKEHAIGLIASQVDASREEAIARIVAILLGEEQAIGRNP